MVSEDLKMEVTSERELEERKYIFFINYFNLSHTFFQLENLRAIDSKMMLRVLH